MNSLSGRIIADAAVRRCSALHTTASFKSRRIHVTNNTWHSRIKWWEGVPRIQTNATDYYMYATVVPLSSPVSSSTLHTHRYFGSSSSNDNNNNNNNKYTTESSTEPKFQDTEVPWYSFFNQDESSSQQQQQLQLLDKTKNNNTQQNKQQPPLPSMSKMLTILIPEYKSLLLALGALTISTAATMQYPNAIGEMIDILSLSSSSISGSSGSMISSVDVVDSIAAGGMDIKDATTGGGVIDASSSSSSSSSSQSTILLSEQQQEQMQTITLHMLSFFGIGAIATFAHSALFDTIGQKIGAQLRKELFTKLINQDKTFFDDNRAGELANRLSTDVHEVAEHLVQNIAHFLSNLVRAITATISMIAISPILTLYLSPLPILLGGSAALFGKRIKHWSKQHLDVLAHSTHLATERFGGFATVLSFGQRDVEQARYSNVIEAAYGYARKVAVFTGGFVSTSYLIGGTFSVGVLYVGSHLVIDGSLTAGQVAGFCMYSGHLGDSVIELSEAMGGFLKAQGSGARLFHLLEREQLDPSVKSCPTTITNDGIELANTLPPSYDATVRFENVQFAYPAHSSVPILNEVSFTLFNGEILGMSGTSGSGKSSIISLLMRFYDPVSGKITLDGRDIQELDVNWLRSQIALVAQEPILFYASVFENVAYGKPDSTQDEVIKACIDADAHRFILELPDEYNTIVGERGASISGGQKQRLCIARALLTKPRILALDESSSALDTESEERLLRHLRVLLESEDNNLSAVLFMTHKRSVLKACDRVASLKDGIITL